MFIGGRLVFHMVDEATHFCAVSFMRNRATKEIWNMIQHMCCLVYMVPPEFLVLDQGSVYTSNGMKEDFEAFGAHPDEAPIETPGAIGTVERYHAPLRLAYKGIRADSGRGRSEQVCLKLAVFAVNCMIGPEGLRPALLVIAAIPRPTRTSPAPSQLERAKRIGRIMNKVAKEQARRKIVSGLKYEEGRKGKKHSATLRKLLSGSPVLAYRTVRKRWEGLFKLISIEGETVVLQLDKGRGMFRSSCVKPSVILLKTDSIITIAQGNCAELI